MNNQEIKIGQIDYGIYKVEILKQSELIWSSYMTSAHFIENYCKLYPQYNTKLWKAINGR